MNQIPFFFFWFFSHSPREFHVFKPTLSQRQDFLWMRAKQFCVESRWGLGIKLSVWRQVTSLTLLIIWTFRKFLFPKQINENKEGISFFQNLENWKVSKLSLFFSWVIFFYKNWNIGNILSPKNWKIILETFQFTKFGKRKWMKPSMTLTRAMSQLKALQVSEKSSDRLKRSPNIPPKTYSIILMIPINTLTYFWYISWPLSKP